MRAALDGRQHELPLHALSVGHGPAAQLTALGSELDLVEALAIASHRLDNTSRRLAAILSVGSTTASAISAALPDASLLRSRYQFAARLALTPQANSTGNSERLCGITKHGEGYL